MKTRPQLTRVNDDGGVLGDHVAVILVEISSERDGHNVDIRGDLRQWRVGMAERMEVSTVVFP